MRSRLVGQRTGVTNQIRGFLITLARNIEIAGDSRTVIRCLLIVSASERQQIAALATQEFLLAPTSGARRQSSMSRPAKRGGVPRP